MKTEEFKDFINRYFDDELTKQEEVFLFTQLSHDEKAREYFKKQNILKTAVQSSVEELPEDLEEKIFTSLPKEKSVVTKTNYFKKYLPAGISALLAVLMFVFSLILYSKTETYREQLKVTIRQINRQQQMIQLLFNSLPATEVKGYLKNQIIVTPKM